MSKESHYLSNEEIKQIAEWFNLHIGDRSCSVCDHKGWYPANFLTTEVIFDSELNAHRQDLFFLTVIVYCKTCGHALYFDARRIGLTYDGKR